MTPPERRDAESRDWEASEPFRQRVARARELMAGLDRFALEAVADAAVALLDEMDGDQDREPCEAGDDGCHYFRCGGREGWGYDLAESGICPQYGIDQSAPLNMAGQPFAGWEERGRFGS